MIRSHLKSTQGQSGATLPVVLLVLLFMSLLGFMALNTSSIEVRLSANEREYQQAVYSAEAGIEHMRRALENNIPANSTASGKWNYALGDNAYAGDITSDGITSDIHNYTYHAYVYDNNDGTPAMDDDSDGLIFVRSDAYPLNTSPLAASKILVSIEVMLEAAGTGGATDDNENQKGGGPGKANAGNDKDEMTDFTMNDLGIL